MDSTYKQIGKFIVAAIALSITFVYLYSQGVPLELLAIFAFPIVLTPFALIARKIGEVLNG